MEIFQLKCVLAVVKYKNFTRAADSINISQSSLSQHISKIEDELGLQLFYRTTRTVELLSPGKEFVKYAQRIVDTCDELKQKMEEQVEQKRHSISFGAIPIIRAYNIHSMITSFIREYNDIVVDFIEAECLDLVDLLNRRKIDVAIIHRLESLEVLDFRDLFLDEFSIVINSAHPLAGQDVLNLEDLSEETFILPSKDSASCQEFIKTCKGIGYDPIILSRCGSVNTIIEFVRANLGLAILSNRVASGYRDSTISLARINPAINRTVSVATLKDVQIPCAVRYFVEFAQKWGANNLPVE